MTVPLLPIYSMSDRHPGLPPYVADSYLNAAIFILDQHHKSPQQFKLNDENIEIITSIYWDEPSKRVKSAFANIDDSKEDGAYLLALAAIEVTRNCVAVRRAERLTGADYYIAPVGTKLDDLENALRLEVSGTELSEADVKRRLLIKVDQARRGKSNLPALAAVVGYKVNQILIKSVKESL
jgi:hypothetical protein